MESYRQLNLEPLMTMWAVKEWGCGSKEVIRSQQHWLEWHIIPVPGGTRLAGQVGFRRGEMGAYVPQGDDQQRRVRDPWAGWSPLDTPCPSKLLWME